MHNYDRWIEYKSTSYLNYRIMGLTNAELDYLRSVPSRLKGIEEQLKRIADLLEMIVDISENQNKVI